MKKLISILLILTLAIGALSACNSAPDDGKAPEGTTPDGTTPGGTTSGGTTSGGTTPGGTTPGGTTPGGTTPEEDPLASKGLAFELSPDGLSYTVTGIGTCTDTDVRIPSKYQGLPVTSIGVYAFYYCRSLVNIEIPTSVTSIGDYAFSSCSSLESISVAEGNEHYASIDGNLYSKDGKTLIQYACGKTATSFAVPAGVTSIGEVAFYYCRSLTSITIPSSVTSIGDAAFSGCSSLVNIEIPTSVTSIGDNAFYSCSSLESIEIPSGVTSIGDEAFYYCRSLTSIEIPSSVTSIGNYAFEHCSSLTSIHFDGNKTAWENIPKGVDWDSETGAYTVYCKDVNIEKQS